MKLLPLLAAAATMLALAGCYTSDTPHLTDANSVAPFSEITFLPRGGDTKPTLFTREDGHYLTRDERFETRLHLMPIEDNDYVAQLAGEKPDELLYGYLRISPEDGTAAAWMIKGDDNQARPGLRPCRDSVCIDDLDAYVAYAKETLDTEPDLVFDITFKR